MPQKRAVRDREHHNPVPWWGKERSKVKRLRKAAYKKWQFTREMIGFIFKKCVATAEKIFK